MQSKREPIKNWQAMESFSLEKLEKVICVISVLQLISRNFSVLGIMEESIRLL